MKPVLQALLLAERIYEDKHTGKKVITGIFNCITFTEHRISADVLSLQPQEALAEIVTGQHPGSPYVYINLTEVHGKTPLTLSYVDLSNGKEIMACEIEAQSESPLDNVEITVGMPMPPILHAGSYALELFFKEEMIGSLRIRAVEKPRGE